jgi:transcriptional regulator with GAF, ATPase, and Fis domain
MPTKPGNRLEPRPLPPPESLPPAILGADPEVLRVLETARRLAGRGQPVLLQGETGTGKELLARGVHHASPRARGPFRAVNCAALPHGLLEAELFGAARGAYTGAEADRCGLVEAAHGGTLFLDEIGDMAPAPQAALLRVLEDGLVRRLGDVEERRVDFSVVAATHRDLGRLVAEGRFRADLLYRLGCVLRLPPLRERRGDVLLLARAFLVEAAAGGRPAVLGPGAETWLLAQPFPGNVRELRWRILSAAALAEDGVVRREDLAGERGSRTSAAGSPPGPGAAALPEALLVAALRRGTPLPAGALVRETGVPRRTAQRALAGLVRKGGLRRLGSGSTTRYFLPGSGMLPAQGASGMEKPRTKGSRTEPIFEIGEGST